MKKSLIIEKFIFCAVNNTVHKFTLNFNSLRFVYLVFFKKSTIIHKHITGLVKNNYLSFSLSFGTEYSRMDQVKFVEDSL